MMLEANKENIENKIKKLDQIRNKLKPILISELSIESNYFGAVLDKDFLPKSKDKRNKITLYFQHLRVHIFLNDYDLKRFKDSIIMM